MIFKVILLTIFCRDMTTIDEIRDITFYIIRKLNDLIINFTREEQPQPRPQPPLLRMTEEEIRRDDERHENIMRQIEEIERSLHNIPPTTPTPPTITPNTPKLIKDIYENLKEINNHHSPRCGTMEEFLENEIQKEKSFALFFDDKKREYEVRKEEIIEILELWKYDNISVDEIRERLNNL